MDESGEVPQKEPNRKDKLLRRRTNKLAEFGIYGSVSKSMVDALTENQIKELGAETGRRGICSLERALLKDCRDRHHRAKQLGHQGVEDRFTSDTQFCHRVHQEGKDMSNYQFDDMFAYGHLPDPPRTRAQFVAGIAANAENEHALTKLLFVSNPKGNYGYPDDFKKTWTKPWGFIFGRRVFTQKGYKEYLEKEGADRMLLTWRGVVKVPEENVTDFLEKQYVANHEAVMTNIERKQSKAMSRRSGCLIKCPCTKPSA